jgi:hypothetical protein
MTLRQENLTKVGAVCAVFSLFFGLVYLNAEGILQYVSQLRLQVAHKDLSDRQFATTLKKGQETLAQQSIYGISGAKAVELFGRPDAIVNNFVVPTKQGTKKIEQRLYPEKHIYLLFANDRCLEGGLWPTSSCSHSR